MLVRNNPPARRPAHSLYLRVALAAPHCPHRRCVVRAKPLPPLPLSPSPPTPAPLPPPPPLPVVSPTPPPSSSSSSSSSLNSSSSQPSTESSSSLPHGQLCSDRIPTASAKSRRCMTWEPPHVAAASDFSNTFLMSKPSYSSAASRITPDQGLALVHVSAQLEPLLTQRIPQKTPNTP